MKYFSNLTLKKIISNIRGSHCLTSDGIPFTQGVLFLYCSFWDPFLIFRGPISSKNYEAA